MDAAQAWAYGIIKNHDGIITVSSEVGHGANFTFFLPASQKQLSVPDQSTASPRKGIGTILMIDDEKMILDVSVQMLNGLGYTCLTADDGQYGGEKVFDQLKTIDPDAKVLLSSGYSMDGHAKKIMQRGCDGFIQKPFTLNEISHKIAEILSQP